MTITNQKQLLVLLVIAGVWAGLLMWRLVGTEEPARVPLVNVTGQSVHQTVVPTTRLEVHLIERGKRCFWVW